MPVIYDGKKLIPGPFATIRKEYQRKTEGAPKVGISTTVVLKGQLVAYKGSPNSSGVFWTAADYPPDETLSADARLGAILRKQKALRDLFSEEAKTLEIQSADGSEPYKFTATVESIDFEEGKWFDTCPYTITLKVADEDSEEDGINDASEEWNIEQADDKGLTYRLTHSVSATGKQKKAPEGDPQKAPWEWARAFVLNRIGLGLKPERMVAPGVMNAWALQAYNYVRSQSLNEYSGTFSVAETWLCYVPGDEPPAVEDFTVTTRADASGKVTVSIEGNIQGLEVRDNSIGTLISTRYANAFDKFENYVLPNIVTRCQTITGLVLNPVALSAQVGRNTTSGVITYSYEYDNRPLSTTGALSESYTVNDSNPTDVYASIPVLGRAIGPVLQDIETVTARRRSINIEIVMPAASMTYTPVKPTTTGIVLSLRPGGSVVFLDQDEESWNPFTGRYTRNVAFTWEL